ncbi:hypothetical protein VTN02DRAFT_4669 [Thermoascus thermophilus]
MINMSAPKPKVLLLGRIDHAHASWASLGEIADLVTPAATNRAEFIQECRDGKLDGVVAAYRTFDSVEITGLVDEELVGALPRSLRYLAHCAPATRRSESPTCPRPWTTRRRT